MLQGATEIWARSVSLTLLGADSLAIGTQRAQMVRWGCRRSPFEHGASVPRVVVSDRLLYCRHREAGFGARRG